MQLNTRGIPYYINKPLVARVTRNQDIDEEGNILITGDSAIHYLPKFSALLTGLPIAQLIPDKPAVYNVLSLDHLQEGDIVAINTDGIIQTLYRPGSKQNFLLFTERCNSNCLMCSQPPKNKNDGDYFYNIYSQLIPLLPTDCEEIGITGGEPTLLGDLFFQLLDQLKNHLPDTEIHCLSNGRTFAWREMTEQIASLNYERLMFGIPVYSDHAASHDYIVQAKGAFNQTMQGLYNLAAIGQRLEIRVVLHKQTIPRLKKLAHYIYRNLPFASHVAFMGLENQGYTPHNIDKLWIDPDDYMNELTEAAEYLDQMGMNVSIYNSQLCVMPERLWRFNRKSISDWKNIYLEKCAGCRLLNDCGGLFASCSEQHSKAIKPFL